MWQDRIDPHLAESCAEEAVSHYQSKCDRPDIHHHSHRHEYMRPDTAKQVITTTAMELAGKLWTDHGGHVHDQQLIHLQNHVADSAMEIWSKRKAERSESILHPSA
jgi:hypothetical protein